MAKAGKANIGAGFGGFRGVHDLNLKFAICDNLRFIELGVKHERGQNAVCAGYGICAMEKFQSHHRSAWW